MEPTEPHIITRCTSCRQQGPDCRAGHALIHRLRAAFDMAAAVTGNELEVDGYACLAGRNRPCRIAYRVTARRVWLFGGVDPRDDIGDLVAAQDVASGAGAPGFVIRSDRGWLQ